MRVPRKARGLSALPLAFLLLAACGGSNTGEHGATPSNNAAGVSALRASTAPVGPPAGTATGTSDNRPPSPPAAPISRSGASAASGTILTEIATDNRFSQTTYTVTAGHQYTLNFQNSGQALHDWRILGQKSAGGKEIAAPLTDGGKTSSVTFIIDRPGTYKFQCDVHPDEMKGTITVQP